MKPNIYVTFLKQINKKRGLTYSDRSCPSPHFLKNWDSSLWVGWFSFFASRLICVKWMSYPFDTRHNFFEAQLGDWVCSSSFFHLIFKEGRERSPWESLSYGIKFKIVIIGIHS